MSNSSLVTYRHIVSHKTKGRGGNKIQKIFVHHMAANLSVKQCGTVFDKRQASAHYGVNGAAIGQYVDESDTAWHCGNFSWNQKSIGIELANDGGASTNWHVSDATINTAIKLIADICKRNGIQKLNYTGNMNGNLCMHKWVVSTSCPGPYLATQFKRIATGVNQLLSGGKIELDVDGIGGEMTTLRTQEFLGTPQDGVISGQIKGLEKYYPAWTTVEFDKTESTMVHALQWLVCVYEDGVLGPDTVKAVQTKLKAEGLYTHGIDGVWGSATMKAWQKYLNKYDKAVFPATHVTKPTPAPAPVKSSWVDSANAWAKKIAGEKYHYVTWTKNTATHTCPICKGRKYDNNYGWNCIGFAFAVWHHGGKLGNKCNCHVIDNAAWEKILKASSADALALAKSKTGLSSIKVIRNKSGIPKSQWQAGDICAKFSGNTYQHTFYYMGGGKIADSRSGKSKASEIAVRDYKNYSAKIIIRYTGK